MNTRTQKSDVKLPIDERPTRSLGRVLLDMLNATDSRARMIFTGDELLTRINNAHAYTPHPAAHRRKRRKYKPSHFPHNARCSKRHKRS